MDASSLDMVRGPLLGKILRFSLPLMATNLLQMLFNAADVVVVGRFAGYASMAAVGSTSSTVFLLTNLLMGLGIGINVIVARYTGEGGRGRDISRTLHTAMTLGLLGGILLGAAGILASDWMLRLLDTPEDIFRPTRLYLRIYFLGTPFVLLYNYGTAVLRAVGDTRRPLYFLLASGGLNLALNLHTVVVLRWDVAGVGLATVVSQLAAALLVLGCLAREKRPIRYHWNRFLVDGAALRKIARIGVPAAVQAVLFSLSNVVIQGAINQFGSVVVAANSAGASLENFLYVAMNAFHQAGMTFIGQNLGAGKWHRVKQVIRICLGLTLGLGLLEGIGIHGWAPELVALFNRDPAVIRAGTVRLLWVGQWYVIFGLADVLVGCIRGFGTSVGPMVINLLGTCAFRLCWIAGLDLPRQGVEMVYLSYPLSWALILIALAGYGIILYRNSARKEADPSYAQHKTHSGSPAETAAEPASGPADEAAPAGSAGNGTVHPGGGGSQSSAGLSRGRDGSGLAGDGGRTEAGPDRPGPGG